MRKQFLIAPLIAEWTHRLVIPNWREAPARKLLVLF
jgi:hypothetical protein